MTIRSGRILLIPGMIYRFCHCYSIKVNLNPGKLSLEFLKIMSSSKSNQSELDLESSQMYIPCQPSTLFKDLPVIWFMKFQKYSRVANVNCITWGTVTLLGPVYSFKLPKCNAPLCVRLCRISKSVICGTPNTNHEPNVRLCRAWID